MSGAAADNMYDVIIIGGGPAGLTASIYLARACYRVLVVEKEKWGGMIENYLGRRENLVQVIQLVDARHNPSADDIMMFDWIKSYNYEPFVIATKLDKLKKSEREAKLTAIYEALQLNETSVLIPFSSESREGRDDVLELIDFVLEDGQVNSETQL